MNPSDPSEKVSLQIMSEGPIIEGENVTLKCQADGNPVPTSFYFHIKVGQSQKILWGKKNVKSARGTSLKGHVGYLKMVLFGKSPDQSSHEKAILLF